MALNNYRELIANYRPREGKVSHAVEKLINQWK